MGIIVLVSSPLDFDTPEYQKSLLIQDVFIGIVTLLQIGLLLVLKSEYPMSSKGLFWVVLIITNIYFLLPVIIIPGVLFSY